MREGMTDEMMENEVQAFFARMDREQGTAFPVAGFEVPGGGTFSSVGMTVRDWFAGQAMAAMMANPDYLQVVTAGPRSSENAASRVAARAYEYADAMLAARTKTEG